MKWCLNSVFPCVLAASKHKEKAERLKQRWLHQQQVASS